MAISDGFDITRRPSLAFNVTIILKFVQQSIAILTVVVLISLSYKKCKTLKVSSRQRQFLIDIHAITTEICQLLLLALAIIHTALVIRDALHSASKDADATKEAEFIVPVILATTWFFLYAALIMVNMIEEWIVLGEFEWLHLGQPFLISKNCLVSLWRYFTKATATKYIKMREEDTTSMIEKYILSRAAIQNRLVRLQYLDLAGVDAVELSRLHLSGATRSIGSTTTGILIKQRNGHTQEKDLPTPPDSNELKRANRVKWAPTITVVSPSGTERRSSMP